ncbi:TPA: DNA polymerase/3'-5' exonuclease PolX [Burkholderia aenigmatica]|uniref:DNA polymerase/3'-5' exonuclease PolX n=1 Tax=Burkholderia sp. AU45251 TaxID=3059204 RepID=UPI00264CE57D|nr:DNA polymerase/3'-5' exonuclease PolX [Burkholderia sp. AU45251]HDR9481667.1 DNA polymerase/3'-5' exonuclease PolX [Burkholderia aenigmatica]MDN7513709.1 DNA polymerase/3'-5' exonuclease PolX [Burkholderia sp. AU45251]HDR9513194.1 DNA polymerase/3'-5' exonuclease PolX [Burkholderia aenigmatica]HDR9590038.1 DNA polymerase/3'-5' exonuclease PolX [Burkholderia aenigmatica]HDR9597957.1 DNA polymerase/3'-5' exonuclease PolX [Burkholderia aenigmatica]
MPIHNAGCAAVFAEIADMLEIQGANPFRVRAYRNAARTIADYGRDIPTMIANGDDLGKIPSIGPDLASKLREIAATGTCELQQTLRHALPGAIVELLDVPGLGAKRVKALHDALHVDSLEQLRAEAKSGHVRELPGFGAKTEAHLLEAIDDRLKRDPQRFLLPDAAHSLLPLLARLRAIAGVGKAVPAGSFRRRRETVGDLDILVTARDPVAVAEAFVGYGEVARVLAHGKTKSSVVLASGLQVDLRVVDADAFGAALVYFTGSKAHNIALRRIAQAGGLKINEYGVFRGDERIAGATEASVYAAIGLHDVPPELREDRGEIDAARAGTLPALVERKHVHGDLHAHTDASAGRDSLRAMADAARARGFAYLAITDRAPHAGVDRDSFDWLARQLDEIDRVNASFDDFALLKGVEAGIREDGSLDVPDAMLGRLDLVVGAVRDGFALSRDAQTARMLRAMDHPHFTILAHPTGRVLGEREACELDVPRVIAHAAARGCFVELDAQPRRLDLPDIWCREAAKAGVPVAIGSEACSTDELDNLAYGVDQARRGWLTRPDVLNTRTLAQLRPLLARTMGADGASKRSGAKGE